MTRDTRTLTTKHFPIEARLVRTLLNKHAADLLPSFTLEQPSERHKLTVTGPAWAFSLFAHALRTQAECNKTVWPGAAKCDAELADKLDAAVPVKPAKLAPVTTAPAPVTTEPAAPAPVTEAPAAPAPLAPVELGTSPAGVEWVVYPKSTETADQFHARVQVGRERLAALHAKQAPASLAPVTVGRWNELTLYPRAGESAAVFHARVEQEHARLLGATPAKEPTLHRDALAHLQGLDEVTYDYLVDAYAEAVDRELSRTPAHEWTEERAEECLDCSALEDQDWCPPRTCDTWQDVYELIREAYERAAE